MVNNLLLPLGHKYDLGLVLLRKSSVFLPVEGKKKLDFDLTALIQLLDSYKGS